MAEIKSTLDLVMERTKHLSMSAEEKAGQQKQDFEKKLQGLLQQYADNVLSDDELLERVTVSQAEMHIDDQMLVVSAVLQRIQPELDNAHWLLLVRQLAPAAYTPLENALVDYQDKVTALAQKGAQGQLERLARDHGVSGSAAVPNLQKDASHQEALFAVKNESQTRLSHIFNSLQCLVH